MISDLLLNKINNLPEEPGIYKFLDKDKRVIYIGKSICLKKRVKSYFVANPKWEKVKKMTSYIYDIEFVVTDTHLEARLLECELIKNIQPIFNSQMKNDEKYIYIKVEHFNNYNPLTVTFERGHDCFGPFRRRYSLLKILNSLKNLYPIEKRDKEYKFSYNLFPHIMDKEKFELNRISLLEIFSSTNNLDSFTISLESEMKKAAYLYRFETAKVYRDIIFSLNYLKSKLNDYNSMFSKDMILKLPVRDGYKLFFISKGKILIIKKYKNPSNKYIDSFIKNGLELSKKTDTFTDEKRNLDYMDIIYSEISSLPKDYIKILD